MQFEEQLAFELDEIKQAKMIKSTEIPNIDLYIEQVTGLLDANLTLFKNGDEQALSKTMINNYTKAGVLPRTEKKKYSQKHMILLMMIYYLKQMFSVQQIKQIFEHSDLDHIDKIYDVLTSNMIPYFVKTLEIAQTYTKNMQQLLSDSGIEQDSSLVLFSALSSFQSAMNNKICTDMLNEMQQEKNGARSEKVAKKKNRP